MHMELVLEKLMHLMKKTRNLSLLRHRVQGDDIELFMVLKRLSSQSNPATSRPIPAMLDMHASRRNNIGLQGKFAIWSCSGGGGGGGSGGGGGGAV